MITLEAADLTEGDASAANVVDYTINGAQVDSSRNVDVKALADGQLAGSKATLYTTPASTTAIVKSITLVNTDSSARTVNLYVQRDGTNSRRIIPKNLTLEANGGSLLLSGNGLQVFSASGEVLYALSSHATDHVTGASDEVDGDKLDIDWNPTNYTPTTTPSEADNVDNLTAHLYGIDQELGQKLENVVEDVTPQLGGDLDCQNNRFTDMLGFLMKAATELTIASGAFTVTQMFHTIDTEGDAATDDLDTINGGSTVNMIVIRAANDARTVVVKHNAGNIWLQGKADISLDDLEDGLLLVWDGTKWFDIAAGGAGGGGFSLSTKGDLHTYDTADAALGVGSNEQRLEADSALAKGIKWAWPAKMRDADGDTLVQVEESADEDKVRMDVGGTEAFLLSNVGILTLAKQSACRMYLSTDQTIENMTVTKVNIDTENYDVQGEGDTANHKITVTEAGKYLIFGCSRFILGDQDTMITLLYKNGAAVMNVNKAASAVSTSGVIAEALDVVELAANDYLELYTWHSYGASRDVSGGTAFTFLGILKVA